MPQISVIVPVYKVEKYIHRCVDSILAQTFTDFELILVDDGSPDNCGAICDEYVAKDSRIHVIHQQNGGLSAARNAGIDWVFANSDSEWIYFADSDDWIHPKSLEVLMDGAKQTGLEVIIGGYECTQGENPIVDEVRLSATVWNIEPYFCEQNVNAVVAWGKLYRRKCFESIRYPVGKIHEDEFITYRILFQFEKIAVIDQPLYAYFQNAEGIMGVRWNPKRLQAVEAFQERVDYFLERDNRNMYVHSIKTLCANLILHLKSIRQSSEDEYKMYYLRVQKRLQRTIIRYRKWMPIEGNEYIYEYAFPHLMGIYWRIHGLRKK